MPDHHILVVDDDPDERAALAELLSLEGYVVAEADSAEAALDILQSRPVDLLIADYQLGGATGAWLAGIASLAMHAPAPRVLLITGHDQISGADGMTVVRKPLDLPQFLSQVRDALALPGSASIDPAGPAQRIAFILYVSDARASRRTINALRSLFDGYDSSQIALTVVNLSKESAHFAEEHRVVVTPTLLKTFPAPRVWIAGELRGPELVEHLLQQAGVEARR